MTTYDHILSDVASSPRKPENVTLEQEIAWIRDDLKPENLKRKLGHYDTTGESVSMLLYTFSSRGDMHAAYDALKDVIDAFPESMKLYKCVGNFFLLEITLK